MKNFVEQRDPASMYCSNRNRHVSVCVPRRGFTLIETLVGMAVFVVVAVSTYQAFVTTLSAQNLARLTVTATVLTNEQIEIIRNLPYEDVGVSGGLPNGNIPHIQTLVRDGVSFTVETTIRNGDDPYDGTAGGSPNDLSPADYRLVEVEVTCATCKNFPPFSYSTRVGPRALEAASTNGSLFIQVFDSAGQPVQGASVHIVNSSSSPPITIDDTTNNDGLLQIIDAPPGASAYQITVSKSGYSTDRTYTPGAPGNPNPSKPHATVAVQQVTQISFSIDHVSTLDVSSVTDTCSAVSGIDFSLAGSKLIGAGPNVLKYDTTHITNGSGRKTISDLEWDSYVLTYTDGTYDLVGTIPLTSIVLNAGATQDFRLVVAPKNPRSLLVAVKDAATQLPVSDATVRLQGAGYDTTLTTGRGFIRQTDWVGGPGQVAFTDPTQYFSSDGNIEPYTLPGQITLQDIFGSEYVPQGYLESSTFDTGSASDFHQILWQPVSQPPVTGANSVRFQIATANATTGPWTYLGPDGTAGSYYTPVDQAVASVHNGDRYFRYKTYLQTASSTWTPTISDVSFTFTSDCVPPGQTFFTGLANGNYTLTVTKGGYQTYVDTVSISSSWQQQEVILAP